MDDVQQEYTLFLRLVSRSDPVRWLITEVEFPTRIPAHLMRAVDYLATSTWRPSPWAEGPCHDGFSLSRQNDKVVCRVFLAPAYTYEVSSPLSSLVERIAKLEDHLSQTAHKVSDDRYYIHLLMQTDEEEG